MILIGVRYFVILTIAEWIKQIKLLTCDPVLNYSVVKTTEKFRSHENFPVQKGAI